MIISRRSRRLRLRAAADPRLLAAAVVVGAALVSPRLAAQAGDQLDPIKCWWRTDASAVIVGERFGLTLTCGIIETDTVRTMVNREALDPAALTLTPFEVVGGTRHADIEAPPWRYFQYQYVVRIVGGEFFGQDVEIPSLGVVYNLVSTSTETAEREHTYLLPALPMRIASLVPKKAADVRDAPQASFGAIEARRFRATTELVAAAVAAGFAALLLGAAIVRTVGRFRSRQPVAARPLSPRTALSGCAGAVRQLRQEVEREGWSHERVTRALAPLRVACAVALGRAIAQQDVEPDTPAREGQLALRLGLLRRRWRLVSAATRADGAPDGPRAGTTPAGPRARGSSLPQELDEALRVFSAARYGRNAQLDSSRLDETLAEAERAIRQLRFRSMWPRRRLAAAPGRRPAGGEVWSR
jgi:hypothetical protein